MTAKKQDKDFHYKYGGSTAGRTLVCQGWRAYADTLPKGPSSTSVADRGTMLHNCCELLIRDAYLQYDDLLKLAIKCGEWTLSNCWCTSPGPSQMHACMPRHKSNRFDLYRPWWQQPSSHQRPCHIQDLSPSSFPLSF